MIFGLMSRLSISGYLKPVMDTCSSRTADSYIGGGGKKDFIEGTLSNKSGKEDLTADFNHHL